MHRVLPRGGSVSLAAFALAMLAAVPAFAKDELDVIAGEIFAYLGDIRPAHLFGAACVFLVIGIFAKAREASGFLIFGSFFLVAVCVAAWIIFALTGDLMGSRRPHHKVAKEEPAAEAPAPKEEVVNASAHVGDKCRKNTDCNSGTVCAKVAGNKSCWAPCTSQGQCDPGFACMASAARDMVCVR